MNEPVAFLNGEVIPASRLGLSVADAGFVQGVTVSEQMRTFGGRLFQLDEHLARLRRSLEIVGIELQVPVSELAGIAADVVRQNVRLIAPGDDLGLSLFVTPGLYPTFAQSVESTPTVCMHSYPIPFNLWAEKYEVGQRLTVSSIEQVDAKCWPPELKCRSRMHYYLADREAAQLDPGSRALLLDRDGCVVESSTANVLVYRAGDGLISPPREKILPGVTVGVMQDLARRLGIPIHHREMRVADVAGADEVFLTSTSPCILPVCFLNKQPIGAGQPGGCFQQFLTAWNQHVGIDIRAQAQRFGVR